MGAEVEGKGCEGEVEQDNGGETEQKGANEHKALWQAKNRRLIPCRVSQEPDGSRRIQVRGRTRTGGTIFAYDAAMVNASVPVGGAPRIKPWAPPQPERRPSAAAEERFPRNERMPMRGQGQFQDHNGVWRHHDTGPEWSQCNELPAALGAWQQAVWPGIGGKPWEGARKVFRDFNTPALVVIPDEAFYANPPQVDDAAENPPYDPAWHTRPDEEVNIQGRFLGKDGEFVDWPAQREAIFGRPPRRSLDAAWVQPHGSEADIHPPWEAYRRRVAAWYRIQMAFHGIDGPLNPEWIDLCFMTDTGDREYALRKVLVDALTRGCTDCVSPEACGSWAQNLKSATAPEMRLVWDAKVREEIAGGHVNHWDLTALQRSRKFLCPMGLVEKPPDTGPIDRTNPDHFRMIRHFSKGVHTKSINERFPYEMKPTWIDYAGGADAVEGLIWLKRRDPQADIVSGVLDLRKMYRALPMQRARYHHYAYRHPSEGLLYDRYGPFELAVIGYYAMYLALGSTWSHRYVEMPLLLEDGEVLPDYILNMFVDDYYLAMARRHGARDTWRSNLSPRVRKVHTDRTATLHWGGGTHSGGIERAAWVALGTSSADPAPLIRCRPEGHGASAISAPPRHRRHLRSQSTSASSRTGIVR